METLRARKRIRKPVPRFRTRQPVRRGRARAGGGSEARRGRSKNAGRVPQARRPGPSGRAVVRAETETKRERGRVFVFNRRRTGRTRGSTTRTRRGGKNRAVLETRTGRYHTSQRDASRGEAAEEDHPGAQRRAVAKGEGRAETRQRRGFRLSRVTTEKTPPRVRKPPDITPSHSPRAHDTDGTHRRRPPSPSRAFRGRIGGLTTRRPPADPSPPEDASFRRPRDSSPPTPLARWLPASRPPLRARRAARGACLRARTT